ncbi:ATP-binding protein [Pseudophaeobacter sp.]|uniref:ATP-binding protein n=1 Tax=Pseudophaeobacter sp. TaxID=1971739 RepID=UPI003297D9B5
MKTTNWRNRFCRATDASAEQVLTVIMGAMFGMVVTLIIATVQHQVVLPIVQYVIPSLIGLGFGGLAGGFWAYRRDKTRELAEHEQLLEVGVEALPLGFAFYDSNGQLTRFNQRYRAMLPTSVHLVRKGLPFETLIRNSAETVAPASGFPDVHSYLTERLDAPGKHQKVWTHRQSTGRWVTMTEHPASNGGFISIIVDITEQKEAEQAQKEGADRYRELFQNSPVPFHEEDWSAVYAILKGLDIDRDATVLQAHVDAHPEIALQLYDATKIRNASDAMLKLYGSASMAEFEAEMRGCDAEPEELAGCIGGMIALFCGERETQYEAKDTTHDGVLIQTRVRFVLPKASRDNWQQVLVSVDDITEWKAAEAQFQKAQRLDAIGKLTGGFAHDFNNLLAIIMGNLELLRDDVRETTQLRLIDASLGATSRGADLIKNMLSFARKARLEPQMVDLNALVKEMEDWAGRALPATIKLETRLAVGLKQVRADPTSTESALLNLLLNARDAMVDGGTLTIETKNTCLDPDQCDETFPELEPGNYVVLTVTDTGTGISPSDLSHIFDPFFTTKPPGAGSGLGLSMIDGFMRQSGGTLRVSSEPGKGATFKLFFKAPKMRAEAVRTTSPSQDLPAMTQHRVLVVEDEPEVRNVVAAMLQRAGCEVTTAATGDAALELFEADPRFDLLVTDVVMPGTLQGPALGVALRKQVPDLKIIFMSGYADETAFPADLREQGDPCLAKPIERQDLLRALVK